MNVMKKTTAAIAIAGATSIGPMNANAWWDDDNDYDRWHSGPWHYGGYPGYGWGGYPGYGWGGYPGYGWGGYPGYGWGGYPGSAYGRTIIINPQNSDSATKPASRIPY